MSGHADTIRRESIWSTVAKIAASDAGGWLMEFTAQGLIEDRDAILAENQRLREALSDLYGYANARLPLTEGADAHLQKAREALAGDEE